MPILVVGGFILISALFIISFYKQASRVRQRRRPSKPRVIGIPLPAQLGLQPTYPLHDIVNRLETAYQKEFGDRLKQRFLQKHPALDSSEFDWQLFELKRYFVLTTVLREVPMFSEPVDEIWHEMLLFSREYESFCHAFAGAVIHHAPHSDPAPNPHGRAWFDWVYCQLFEATPYSVYIWKNFFRSPLDQQQLREFRNRENAQLLPLYFNANPAVRETAIQLIETLRNQMKTTRRPTLAQQVTDSSMLAGATTAFVFFSLYEAETFVEEMDKVIPNNSACGGASFVCATPSDDSPSNNSSCSSSSCSSSSCSSSSCGSSCGSS
jgi:hypothetical protein